MSSGSHNESQALKHAQSGGHPAQNGGLKVKISIKSKNSAKETKPPGAKHSRSKVPGSSPSAPASLPTSSSPSKLPALLPNGVPSVIDAATKKATGNPIKKKGGRPLASAATMAVARSISQKPVNGNLGNNTPTNNGVPMGRAHCIFFPQGPTVVPQVQHRTAALSHSSNGRKSSSLPSQNKEQNKELVQKISAILAAAPALRPAEPQALRVQTATPPVPQFLASVRPAEPVKSGPESTKNVCAMVATTIPLPRPPSLPEKKKPSQQKKLHPNIAPQRSQPTPHPQVAASRVQHLLAPSPAMATNMFFQQLQQPVNISSSSSSGLPNIVPTPSNLYFTNGPLTSQPAPKMIAPAPVILEKTSKARKAKEPVSKAAKKPRKASERKSKAAPVSRTTVSPPAPHPEPQPPVLQAEPEPVSLPKPLNIPLELSSSLPVSVNEDLDQLLSSVQSKISQEFDGSNNVLSLSLLHPASPTPLDIDSDVPTTSLMLPPKQVKRQLKKVRRSVKILDVALDEDIMALSRCFGSITVSEKVVTPQLREHLAPEPSGEMCEDVPRILPFKKRQYKSVPSPKTRDATDLAGKSAGTQSGRDKNASSSASVVSSRSPGLAAPKEPAAVSAKATLASPPSLGSPGKAPTIKIKINRGLAGQPVVCTSPQSLDISVASSSSPASSSAPSPAKGSRKRTADSSSDMTKAKRRRSVTKTKASTVIDGYFDMQCNTYAEARLSKPNRDIDLQVCECRPVASADRTTVACGEECHSRMLCIECDPEQCPCGPGCSNQTIQKRQWVPGLELFPTEKKGQGVRSSTAIKRGTFICEYVGEVISTETFRDRMSEQYKDCPHHYCLKLDGATVIDAYRCGSIARFINHSCEPNCHVEKWMVNGQYRMAVFALKDIPPNEEIMYDYNFDNYDVQQKCFCGAKSCRGIIGSKKQKLNGLLMKKRALSQADAINGTPASPKTPPQEKTTMIKSAPVVTTGPEFGNPTKKVVELSPPSVSRIPHLLTHELSMVSNRRICLVRNIIKGAKFTNASETPPAKRPKPMSIFSPSALPKLTIEALAELKGIDDAPKLPVASSSSVKKTFPASYFKPVPWEPNITDIKKHFEDTHEEVIRCICNLYLEEGLMIECDSCSAWQHCECMGVIHKDSYHCERCNPRPVPTEIPQNLSAALNPDKLDCYVTLMVPNCQNFQARVGDCVYLTKDRKLPQPNEFYDPLQLDILHIDKMFVDGDGTKRAYGHHYLRPHETFHEATRSFYENELLMSPHIESVKLEAVLGRCCVMDLATYMKGRPREYPLHHCFICDLKVNKVASKFDKTTAKERIPFNTNEYCFENYHEKLQVRRNYKPHQVPVLKKKLKAEAAQAKKKIEQPKAIIHFIKEKCERIQHVAEKLKKVQQKRPRNSDKLTSNAAPSVMKKTSKD